MKKAVKKAVPIKGSLEYDLAQAKASYASNVKEIKLRHKFKEATNEQRAKMIYAETGDQKRLEYRFYNLKPVDRLEVAKIVLSKALTVKYKITESMYLTTRLTVTDTYYGIDVYLPNRKIKVTVKENLTQRPTVAEVTKVISANFPNVQSIYQI